MSKSGNISIYKDGKDVYIRIANCEESLEKILAKMINSAINEVKDIVPIESKTPVLVKPEAATEVKEEARFTFYPYKGLTPTEVVSKIGMVKAYIYFKKTPIYSSNKDELKRDIAVHVEKHKKLLREKLSKADSVSFDERMVFFNEYRCIFPQIDNIVRLNGAETLEEYIRNHNDGSKRLYKTCIENLL